MTDGEKKLRTIFQRQIIFILHLLCLKSLEISFELKMMIIGLERMLYMNLHGKYCIDTSSKDIRILNSHYLNDLRHDALWYFIHSEEN
jgi:hypothetical protein